MACLLRNYRPRGCDLYTGEGRPRRRHHCYSLPWLRNHPLSHHLRMTVATTSHLACASMQSAALDVPWPRTKRTLCVCLRVCVSVRGAHHSLRHRHQHRHHQNLLRSILFSSDTDNPANALNFDPDCIDKDSNQCPQLPGRATLHLA